MTAPRQYHVPQTYFVSPLLIHHVVARLESVVNAHHHSKRQPWYSHKFATERTGALAIFSETFYDSSSSSTDDDASSTTVDYSYEYSGFLDDFFYDDDYSPINYDDSSSVFDDDSSSVFDGGSSWSYYNYSSSSHYDYFSSSYDDDYFGE